MIFTVDSPVNEEDLKKLAEMVNTGPNPVVYLAIDPGKTNGVCGYDAKYYLQFMFTIPEEQLSEFLHVFERLELCIIEGYSLFPNKLKEQVYSDMLTPRVIGRVEEWARIKKIKLVKQEPKIKTTGYKWIGKKPLPKSNPRNHSLDAHVHFMYWAIRHKKISAASLLRLDNA
jgi:hypothetical protein